MKARLAFALLAMALVAVPPRAARADATEDPLFTAGVLALDDERPNDAVASFEALADRGVIDAAVSFDRGLAYAARVRLGAEQPGDLGKAAHGFEEAMALAEEAQLARDAERALTQVRTEIGRRRAREGNAVEIEPRRPAWRALSLLLSENTWSALAIASSLLLGAGLFFRWKSPTGRRRGASTTMIAVAVPALVLTAALAATARHDRLYLREAVIVAASARPSDIRGIALPGGTPLPEGARVELVGTSAAWTQVRAGSVEAWIPTSALRPIARPN